jgi:hypothetical protein
MSPSKITEETSIPSLANQINNSLAKITSWLQTSSHQSPTFSASSPPDISSMPNYETLRAALNDDILDLLRLVNGPKTTLREFVFSHYDLAALQVALDRKFFDHVPLSENKIANGETREVNPGIEDTITAADIADKVCMDEDRTAGILRLLATHRIFEEVGEGETGRFRHTASSALSKKDQDFNATADMQ